MVKTLPEYVTIFFCYAFLGWCMETIYMGIREHHLTKRGFLLGPYCPIYGVGLVGITLLLQNSKIGFFGMFFIIIILCSVLEYFASLIMERLFHTRWWDYHDMKFNINGRICLETMLPFGVLGSFALLRMNPFFIHFLHQIPTTVSHKVLSVLGTLFLLDLLISVRTLVSLSLPQGNGDHTAEISKRVRENIIKFIDRE